VLIGGIGILALNQTSTNGVNTSVSICARGYASAIANAIETYSARVNTAALDSRITNASLSRESKEIILADLANKLGFISIGTADANGDTLNGANIADREYFKHAIKGETYISSPVIRKTDQTIVLFIAAKINNGTRYEGVVYAALSNDTFSAMTADAKIGQKGYAFVLDKTGTVIAHPDSAMVTGFFNYITKSAEDAEYRDLAELSKKMIALENGLTTLKIDGADKIVAYQPIAGTDGWSVAIVADRDEMFAAYDQNLKILIAVGVAVLLAGIVVAI
jgi:methyl-accepting chemotaxis protein